MMNAKQRQLVDAVESRLREEWGESIHCIPEHRLREEVANHVGIQGFALSANVCVKIPSRSEFTMTLDEARAVLAKLDGYATERW